MSESARCKQKGRGRDDERKEKRVQLAEKRRGKKKGEKTHEGGKREGKKAKVNAEIRWKRGRGGMDEVEERPGIRMQIDVIAHDAAAHGSAYEIASWPPGCGWGEINEKSNHPGAGISRIFLSAPESRSRSSRNQPLRENYVPRLRASSLSTLRDTLKCLR